MTQNFDFIFLIVALLASSFYGFFAYEAFGATKPSEKAAKIHQFWYNFLGSIVGWTSGGVLILKVIRCNSQQTCSYTPQGWELLAILIAFVGMTGQLPRTTQGALEYLGRLAQKAKIGEKTCPKCAEQIKTDAVVCRFCKYSFEKAQR